jgi:outer membrane protein assembly factor BamB
VLDMTPHDDRTLSWGFASSPTLFEVTILVQSDTKKDGFAAAFAAADGRELWRVPRSEVSVGSWGSPGVIRAGGRTQVVLNGYPWIAGYDFKTGKELWRMRSGGDVPVPTPFLADGLIYVANAHGKKAPLYAIRPDASGDISVAEGATSSSGVVWTQERNGSYLQTPVVYEGIAYACTSQGVFKAYDAKTGERFYEQRLGGGTTGFTSSPVAAGGRIYVTSEEGETYVVKHGKAFELLGKNLMGETVLSTPAISNGELYFHTRGHVVAVGE